MPNKLQKQERQMTLWESVVTRNWRLMLLLEVNIVEIGNLRGILRQLDSDITPRNMICVAHGHFGMTTCMSVAGIDHGCVYALDTEMRYFWTAETLAKYPKLAPSIKEFFCMRDSGKLPERPWGYENCYLIAESFDEYLTQLHPATED